MAPKPISALPPVFHKSSHSVGLGQTIRLEIEYSPYNSPEEYATSPPPVLYLRVRNSEPLAMRAAYLAGPYSLYVDCRPAEYDIRKKCFVSAEQPVFEPQLHPAQTFHTELNCNTFKPTYKWSVDVSSQMLFSVSQSVKFEVQISSKSESDNSSSAQKEAMAESNSALVVNIHDTLDLWNLPVPDPTAPIHLVILTHGLHSNVSADMLFLKEMIDQSPGNVVVKGFFRNVCKTERGIKYLGSRVAEYVVELLRDDLFRNTSHISFVGHSLGGLVQTFAIAYLQVNYPWVFQKVEPVNFITLASPMLGIAQENPAYVKLALSVGIAGRTGHDLGLKYSETDGKPLLLLLPSGATHQILKRFARRTVYANAFNDGIVPLRTSALLYLDEEGLAKVLGSAPTSQTTDEGLAQVIGTTPALEKTDDVPTSGKIPRDLPENNQDSQTSGLGAIFSYFMPQKQSQQSDKDELEENGTRTESAIKGVTKPSVIESAASILLPPLPSMKYITDPDSRENVVIHDQIYTEDDLPQQDDATDTPRPGPNRRSTDSSDRGMMQMLTNKSEELRQLLQGNMTEHYEEEIAREYHKQMSWRKVLVNLERDAHNNIVVRRRFSNAYGWPVIEHLVKNHFEEPATEMRGFTREDSLDACEDGLELRKLLSVEAIQRENEELDKQPIQDGEHAWLNINEKKDIYDGPAGMFSDLSEKMYKLKHEWEEKGVKAFRNVEPDAKLEDKMEGTEPTNYRVMEGFW